MCMIEEIIELYGLRDKYFMKIFHFIMNIVINFFNCTLLI